MKNYVYVLILIGVALVALSPIDSECYMSLDHKRFESFDSFDSNYWVVYGNGSYECNSGILHLHIPKGTSITNLSSMYLFTNQYYWGAKISVCFKLSNLYQTDIDMYRSGVHFSCGFGNYIEPLYPPTPEENVSGAHNFNEATFEFNTNSKHDYNNNTLFDSGDCEYVCMTSDNPIYEKEEQQHRWTGIFLEDFFIDDNAWHTLTIWWHPNEKIGYWLDNIKLADFQPTWIDGVLVRPPNSTMSFHFGAFNYLNQSQAVDIWIDWIEIQCYNWLDNAHVSWGDWFSSDSELNSQYWYSEYYNINGLYFDAYDKVRLRYEANQGYAYTLLYKREKIHVGELIIAIATWGLFNTEFRVYLDNTAIMLMKNNQPTKIYIRDFNGNESSYTVANYYDGQYRNLRIIWAYENDTWKFSVYWDGNCLSTFNRPKSTHHTNHDTMKLNFDFTHFGTASYCSTIYLQYIEYWVLNSYYGMY